MRKRKERSVKLSYCIQLYHYTVALCKWYSVRKAVEQVVMTGTCRHTAASDRHTNVLQRRVAVLLYSPLRCPNESNSCRTPPFPSTARSTSPSKSKLFGRNSIWAFASDNTHHTYRHMRIHTQGDPWYASTKGYACLNITYTNALNCTAHVLPACTNSHAISKCSSKSPVVAVLTQKTKTPTSHSICMCS